MDHKQAVRTQAVARYLLKEMCDEEYSAFEEHYVGCQECSDQVKLGFDLSAAARELPVPAHNPSFLAKIMASFRQPAFSFVCTLLVATAGLSLYQRTLISELKEPKPELRYVLTGIAHGASDTNLIQVPRSSILSLSVEYHPDGEFVSYQAQINEASGKVKYAVQLPASQTGDKATIAVPAGALSSGRYSVVVKGRTSDGAMKDLGQGAFQLQFLD